MTFPANNFSGILTVDDYMKFPGVPPDHHLSYGPDSEQFGDLYLPKRSGQHPVVLLLHGGCWQARFGLEALGSLSDALRSKGFAVWNLEYRRLGNGGGWPTTFEDVIAGTEFLREIDKRYSLDLSRVIAIGHSAGGHLALWLAGRHRFPVESLFFSPNPMPIHGVVALAGIPDLIEGVKRNICFGACREIVGGSPEEVPDRYKSASPAAFLPLGIPQRHIIGSLDQVIPIDYIRKYVKVDSQGDDVSLKVVPDAGHFELVVPANPAWPVVRAAVDELAPDRPAI